MTNRSTNCA